MTRGGHLAVFTCVLLAFTVPQAKGQGVNIKREPARTREAYFDRDRPPPNVPSGAAGVTRYDFACYVSLRCDPVSITRAPNGAYAAEVKISQANLELRLPMLTYLPRDASWHLRDHERGHQSINEYIYQHAEKYARDVVRSAASRTYRGVGLDQSTAIKSASEAARQEVLLSYRQYTQVQADRVNQIFDGITHHGMNNVSNQEAIREAFERASSGH